MQANPELWKNIPIIKVANPELRRTIGMNGKYTSFNSIVRPREMGGYILSSAVQAAYAKESNHRNKLDKEIMNVDERVNILMAIFTGDFLTIFRYPTTTTTSGFLLTRRRNFLHQMQTSHHKQFLLIFNRYKFAIGLQQANYLAT